MGCGHTPVSLLVWNDQKRTKSCIYGPKKLEAVADSKGHDESPLGLWKKWEELV